MKRGYIPNVFKNKRSKLPRSVNTTKAAAGRLEPTDPQQNSTGPASDADNVKAEDLPSDTKAALVYLRSLFNVQQFECRVPPILLKHQLYSIIQCKTQVDKEVDELRERREIKLFRFGKEVDEFCIVFCDDYCSHIRKVALGLGLSALIERFVTDVVEKLNNITFTHQTLCDEHGFKDKEITQLVNAGVLTVRDVGSWWLSIPGAGIFMKNFSKGRQSVLRTIRKAKYREILQNELESRKLQAVKKLSMQYHIHDIIGAELVTKVKTTSGTLLRLDE